MRFRQLRQCLVQRMLPSRRLTDLLPQAPQRRAVHLPGEHIPRAGKQIVRLVHQQRHVSPSVENALNMYRRVKGIVVIADHYVRQLRQGQRKLERA